MNTERANVFKYQEDFNNNFTENYCDLLQWSIKSFCSLGWLTVLENILCTVRTYLFMVKNYSHEWKMLIARAVILMKLWGWNITGWTFHFSENCMSIHWPVWTLYTKEVQHSNHYAHNKEGEIPERYKTPWKQKEEWRKNDPLSTMSTISTNLFSSNSEAMNECYCSKTGAYPNTSIWQPTYFSYLKLYGTRVEYSVNYKHKRRTLTIWYHIGVL